MKVKSESDFIVDIRKLKTVYNYAVAIDKTPQRVYQLINDDKVKKVVIDGVLFIEG